MKDITTCLMFSGPHYGQAKSAIDFYVALFSESGIQSVDLYGPNDGEQEGTVRVAEFTLKRNHFIAMDSVGPHNFNFTPSISFVIQCDSEDEINHLFAELSHSGEVLMPLDNYGFSPRFGWVNDRFGVSWQLNLAE